MMADSSSMHSAAGILTYWKDFDLPNLQKELDEIATDLANRQDESDASRKKLVEQSKDFKKNATEDVRKGATPLLKSFQGEVDSLSKRSKAAEAAFLDLYKKIIETPDPVSALEGASQWQKKAQRVSDLEIENANFRETLDQYNAEFAEVKNQEVTIRQLKEKVKNFEDHLDKEVEEKVKEKETTMQRFFQDRERQLQEAGGILSMKLQEAERRSEAVQSSLTAAQQELFSFRARADDSRDARATEVEMIVADLERANQRAEGAEREALALKEELESVRSTDKKAAEASEAHSNEDFTRQLQAMETELTAKDKQIRQLLEEVKHMNIRMAETSANFEEETQKLRKEAQDKTRALDLLESRLTSQADYEEVKKELSVMKSIEFGSGEDGPEVSESGKSLEVLLLEKNKGLQTEKTALTLARKELEGTGEHYTRSSVGSLSTPSVSSKSERERAGPFQKVVDALECLVGAELVSAYTKSQCGEGKLKREFKKARLESCLLNASAVNLGQKFQKTGASVGAMEVTRTPNTARKSINNSGGRHRSFDGLAIVKAAVDGRSETPTEGKPEVSLSGASQDHGDIDKIIKKYGLFDFDQAIREGMPKDLAELAVAEQLQGFIQKSVTKLGETPLNTVEIAGHCRQLLAMYNLGQRLFAKTVLSQSQGSLSELLSKPRPWHRLTEKGREAFRKIHAWVSDDRTVVLLRTLSPRRTFNPGSIVPSGVGESPLPATPYTSPATSLHLAPTTSAPPVSKPLPADATETIMQCLQEAKAATLQHQQQKHPQLQHNNQSSSAKCAGNQSGQGKMGSPNSGSRTWRAVSVSSTNSNENQGSRSSGQFEQRERDRSIHTNNRWRHDDIPKEMIMEIYQRELNKLKEQEHSLCQELRGRASKSVTARPVIKKEVPMVQKVPSTGSHPARRSDESSRDSTPFNPGDSPQQPISGTKALKAILPPISQEQFEKYNNVVTEELVKTIKDFLTQQSISQRLFGENILGLSQGSVSDLLARPKPWHMLTQKGREPFIRMQMFLEDEAAIQSLKSKKPSPSPGPVSLGSCGPRVVPMSNGTPSSSNVSPSVSVSDGFSCLPSTARSSSFLLNLDDESGGHNSESHSRSSSVDFQPRIGGDLDTEEIADQVKDILHQNGIGQKLFGEAVLGVSQGTVSELLSKPKVWQLLSLRGREPYIRMHWWLQDPNKVEKLQEYGSSRSGDQKITSKRPYDIMNSEWNSSGASALLFGPSPQKKPRSLITEQQKEALRFAFEHEPYPSSRTIEFLSEELSLSVRTVINWFHNHRMRIKLQNPSVESDGFGQLEVGTDGSDHQVSSSDSSFSAAMAYFGSSSFLPNGGKSNSYAKNLEDLISMLSSTEEQQQQPGGSGGGGMKGVIKEEPVDEAESSEMGGQQLPEEPESSGRMVESRKSLVEKLEQSVNQSDLDWNAGLREEALTKLSTHVTRNEQNSWEF